MLRIHSLASTLRVTTAASLVGGSFRPAVAAAAAAAWLQPQLPLQQQQQRCKHSERQIKRLFRKNPARARVRDRLGHQTPFLPLEPAQFEPIHKDIHWLPNGWSAPPSFPIPDYPFQVHRTKNKPNDAVGFLPVYATFRNDKTKVKTRIKKVTGDRDLFISELRALLQAPAPKSTNPRDDRIRIRTGGTIEVDGHCVREIKQWLAGLGF